MLRRRANPDPDAFWEAVRTKLRAWRLRLVFVTVVVPVELRRIVEFLNEEMPNVDVLAVELRQFVGQGVRALVLTVLGLTGKERPGVDVLWRAEGPAAVYQGREAAGTAEPPE